MKATLAILPGDGIGPETIKAAIEVLRVIETRFGHSFELKNWPIGANSLRSGQAALPAETLSACLSADAVLLGAVGDPDFDALPRAERPEAGLLELRKALGTYANLRPARVWPGLEHSSSLRPDRLAGTDLLIVRELTGGLYFGEPRGIEQDRTSAINTLRYSRNEIERIAKIGFEAAQRRRRRLTSVDKANVLETSELWRSVVIELSASYPDVTLEHMYVDACAMSLVLEPSRFDVVVTENLFGDILSDEAGAIVGSLGLLPSASLGNGTGLFEPVHGSAPTIAGKDIANPIGTIASTAMLLRHGLGAEEEALAIERAVEQTLADGFRTVDLAHGDTTSVSCSKMTEAITERLVNFDS